MSEADLREKIAEVVREAASCPRLCDWLAPGRCACGRSADAILALVHPAIQAARVEALREAAGSILRYDITGFPSHDARRAAKTVRDRAIDAIAALIEKETAP